MHGTATYEHYLTSYTATHLHAPARAFNNNNNNKTQQQQQQQHTHSLSLCQNCLKLFRACNFTVSSTIFQIWKFQQPSFQQFHTKKSKNNLKTSGFSAYTYVKHISEIFKSIRTQCNIRQTILKGGEGGGLVMRRRLKGLSATHCIHLHIQHALHVAEATMEKQVSNCDSQKLKKMVFTKY